MSGGKPPASIASATPKSNDPAPCAMSNSTPRSLARQQASSTRPSAVQGALGNGLKQWVRMSPGRRSASTSARRGGGRSMWHMTGKPARSAAAKAWCRGAMPFTPLVFMPTRTFTMRIRSGCARATAAQVSVSIRRMSKDSPTIAVLEKAKMPAWLTCRAARMRVWLGSMTWVRKPAKLPGPAEPASSQVVVPLRRASASASMLMLVPPQ